jgi:hypothetical protein
MIENLIGFFDDIDMVAVVQINQKPPLKKPNIISIIWYLKLNSNLILILI